MTGRVLNVNVADVLDVLKQGEGLTYGERRDRGLLASQVARRFGIGQATVSRLAHGDTDNTATPNEMARILLLEAADLPEDQHEARGLRNFQIAKRVGLTPGRILQIKQQMATDKLLNYRRKPGVRPPAPDLGPGREEFCWTCHEQFSYDSDVIFGHTVEICRCGQAPVRREMHPQVRLVRCA